MLHFVLHKGFFRRCIIQGLTQQCSNGERCEVTPMTRNSCQYCRLKKCFAVGMSRGGRQLFFFLYHCCCCQVTIMQCVLSQVVGALCDYSFVLCFYNFEKRPI